jgi:hypothetical protein
MRYQEVADASHAEGIRPPVVAIVPIRMTEAWLLLDEAEIRRVAGRPNGREALGLPTHVEAERMANPKQRLLDVLIAASETSGRRRDQFKRDFDRHRSLLLERLDIDGAVTKLQAWQRMRTDIAAALERVTSAP